MSISVGIIGTGLRGRWIANLIAQRADDFKIVALADNNSIRLNEAEKYISANGVCLYKDYNRMLSKENLDAVVVTVPDFMHGEVAVAALKAGSHLFLEKPIATTVEDALRIADTARQMQKRIVMGFNLRYHPTCVKIKEIVDSGELGRISMISNQDFYEGGCRYMSRWNRLRAKSGGLFIHKGTHDLDLCNWYAGQAMPVRVHSSASLNVLRGDRLPFDLKDGEQAGPWCSECKVTDKCPDYEIMRAFRTGQGEPYGPEAVAEDGYHVDNCIYASQKDTHDTGVTTIEYASGVIATHWECFHTALTTRRFSIVGDRGHLEADTTENKINIYPRWSRKKVEIQLEGEEDGHGGADPAIVADVARVLRDGSSPRASIREGIIALAVAEASEIAWRENRVVEISELLDRNHSSLVDTKGKGACSVY